MNGQIEKGRPAAATPGRPEQEQNVRFRDLSIILTSPRDCNLGGYRAESLERWDVICREAGVPHVVQEPTSAEIHGELLTRLWIESIYEALDGGGSVLVSEIDFVPDRRLFRALAHLDTDIVFAPYSTRIYQPGKSTVSSPGKIALHAAPDDLTVPLTGAWFMLLTPGKWVRNVPLDWLGAAGPFNDAANLAHLTLSQLPEKIRPRVGILRPQDLHPLCHGVEYPGIGAHLFFARHSGDEDSRVCCWPECDPPLTGALVRRGYKRFFAGTAEAFYTQP